MEQIVWDTQRTSERLWFSIVGQICSLNSFTPSDQITQKIHIFTKMFICLNPTKKATFSRWLKWRRRWDSNPRNARTFDGFQDRSDQPLWHSSKQLLQIIFIFYMVKIYCQDVIYNSSPSFFQLRYVEKCKKCTNSSGLFTNFH